MWVAQECRAVTGRDIEKKARHLERFLYLSFFLLRKHQDPLSYGGIPGVSTVDQALYASSFRASDLKQGLGGSTGDYEKYLRLFWHFLPGNRSYSRERRITKAYVLKKDATTCLTAAWRDPQPEVVIDRRTGMPLRAADLPSNGIVRTSFSEITVPSIISFDVTRVEELIDREETVVGEGSTGPISQRQRRTQALRLLYLVRKWLLSFGGVPNLYKDFDDVPTDGNGRLSGIGELHLQTLKKSARRLLYSGTGWWDFDFKACHWSILHSLCRGHGLETPVLDDYLANREEINALIAEDLEVPVRRMKQVMNSLLYDQPLAINPYSSLVQALGKPAAQRLIEDCYFLWLHDELKGIRQQLIEGYLVGDEVVNVVGKRRSIYTETLNKAGLPVRRRVPSRRLLSHILTGYEAWALNLVCRDFNDVLVLMHDGWMCQFNRDAGDLEKHILKQSTATFKLPLLLNIKAQQFLT